MKNKKFKVLEPIMVEGFEIILEKKKVPPVEGSGGRPHGSVWDKVLDVIKKGDSFLMRHHRSSFGCFYTREKKKKMKIVSRTEICGGHKRLRVYRVK